MAIKGGSIIHAGNGTTVLDRVQTGGPGQVNIPTEKIYELGNDKSVAIVRDTPDLQFGIESYDTSTEFEEFVTGLLSRSVADGVTTAASPNVSSASAAFVASDVGKMVVITDGNAAGVEYVGTIASVTSGTAVVLSAAVPTTGAGRTFTIATNGINLGSVKPVDIASQFKAGPDATDPFAVVGSVAVPFLYLESMSYRYGLHDNATQTGSLRGDTIFYNPGAAFVQNAAGSGTAGQTVITSHPAHLYADPTAPRRILSVTVGTQRLTLGPDYTESVGTITGGAAITTITLTAAVPTTTNIRIMYSSPDLVDYDQSVHPSAVVRPAAIKGRDIEIYVGGYDPNNITGSQANRLKTVQSVQVDFKVTVSKDEEFGNYYSVGVDVEVPAVTGSIDFLPGNPQALQALIRKTQGVTDPNLVLGTTTSTPLVVDIVLKNPTTGKTMKRLQVPDARFTPPGFQGRVQAQTTVSFPLESDAGDLLFFAR